MTLTGYIYNKERVVIV